MADLFCFIFAENSIQEQWRKRLVYNFTWPVTTQQIGFNEAPLCVLLVPEILCSSTKLTFALILSARCVFHVFGCALSVYHLSSHWVYVCLLWVYVVSSTRWTQNSFKSAHREHNNSWTHASTNCWEGLGFNWKLLICVAIEFCISPKSNELDHIRRS